MYCYSYLDVVLQVRCINFTVIEGPGAVHGPVNGFRGVGDGGSRDRDRVHYDAKSTTECASICSRSRLCDQGLRRCHGASRNPLQYEPRGSKQGLRNQKPQRLEHDSFYRLNLRETTIANKDCVHEISRKSVLCGLRCSGCNGILVAEPFA
jgi:hypothetical protein